MTDPAALRRRYGRDHLDDDALAGTWLEQLREWFDEAVADPAVVEANAISLATADASGLPDVRTVLVKAIDERGIVVYTNYDSAKGRELEANPRAAAVFPWLAQERQVRIQGSVARVTREETDAYFASRPRESQLGAWASPQSQVVADRGELDAAYAAAERRFADGPVPAPPFWGGYLMTPDAVEFWQGRAGRMHDRIRYRRTADASDASDASGADTHDGWTRERLAP